MGADQVERLSARRARLAAQLEEVAAEMRAAWDGASVQHMRELGGKAARRAEVLCKADRTLAQLRSLEEWQRRQGRWQRGVA